MIQGTNFTFYGVTVASGATGSFSSFSRILEDELDNPVKVEGKESIYFMVRNMLHCHFGPAIYYPNYEAWYIKGDELSNKEVLKMKSILADIKLAPLYLNDPIFRYTARWVLKDFKI